MKNSISIIVSLFVIGGLIGLIGCQKDDDSAYQPKGNYGNADIHSQTFTVVTWILDAPSYYCEMVDSDITQEIVDNGSVEVFMNNGSGGWIALPCTLPITSTYASTYTPVHYLNGVTVWKTDTDLGQTADPGTKTFKIICIHENVLQSNPNVNWKNYSEIQEIFKLSD